VPTLSAVRELDFIESLKSKRMNHQCHVKSVNAIVRRSRNRKRAQLLFQTCGPLRAARFVAVTFLAASKARIIAAEIPVAPLRSALHVLYDPPSSAILPAFSCPVSTGDRQGCGLEKASAMPAGHRRVSAREETTFDFRGRQDSCACRDCQLYVDSGKPITLPSVDCNLRCSSGILVCGMNFLG
jgi:hypothetical protein